MYICVQNLLFCHYSIFFLCTPKCPGSYPWGYVYPRLGITTIHHSLPVQSGTA